MNNKKVEKITKILANIGMWADNSAEKVILSNGITIFDSIKLKKGIQNFYLDVTDIKEDGLIIFIFDDKGEIVEHAIAAFEMR